MTKSEKARAAVLRNPKITFQEFSKKNPNINMSRGHFNAATKKYAHLNIQAKKIVKLKGEITSLRKENKILVSENKSLKKRGTKKLLTATV